MSPKILDQHGRPIDRRALEEPQTARIALLENQYVQPTTNGLTPARLAAILLDADNGNLVAQHELFEDMEERDAHLAAELEKRKLALVGLDWDIVPPRNATAAEKAAAEWVKEVLQDMGDFEDLLLALMDGVGHGFAPIELEWRREGAEWLPDFHPRPQRWFQLSRSRREFRLTDLTPDGQALIPFGWIFHTHARAKTGYLGRMGLHRVLVWPFLYKAYGIGDFAEFLETFGLPIIVGKYYPGADAAEKASLMRAVTQLGHDARAIMPKDMELEIQKITGGGEGSQHMKMVDWAERSQSKAILGQTLSAEARATGLGSGVADFHAEVRWDILRADARQVAGTLTRDLVYPLIALNRGGIDSLRRCPRLMFDTGESEDLKLFSEALPELVGVGMRVPLKWAHEKLRIPEPAEGEAVLQVARPDRTVPPELRAEAHAAAAATRFPRELLETTHGELMAALGAEAGEAAAAESFPDQAALDAALEAIPAEALQRQMEQLIGPVLKALQEAAGYEEAMAVLAGRYPQLDAAQLETLLARALFAAELWGAASAEARGSE